MISGLQLIERLVAIVNAGPGEVVVTGDGNVPVMTLTHDTGIFVRASSGSTRGGTFLSMAERARVVSPEHAALVRDHPEPVAELAARGLLSPAAVDTLSVFVASVDLGHFVAARGRATLTARPGSPSLLASGMAIIEFVKQAVIVCGDVDVMLDAMALDPQDNVERGKAFEAAIDQKSRQLLDTLASRMPLTIHDALGLAGDDLTRRKVAATVVVTLATGHLTRAPPAAKPHAADRGPPPQRLTSLAGVMALDLSQDVPSLRPPAPPDPSRLAPPMAARAVTAVAAAPATTATPATTSRPPPPPVRAVSLVSAEFPAVVTGASSSPSSSPSWRKETLREHQLRRAADLNVDLDNPENAAALEREYLGVIVPRGLAASATTELLVEARRWVELAPQDPTAVVSCARVRWAAEPQGRPEVLKELAAASGSFPGVIDVQWTLFELAIESGDKEKVAMARRRFLAVASPTDPRRASIDAARPARVSLDVGNDGPALARAAGAVVLVPVLTALAVKNSVGDDVGYQPGSLPWLMRHGILLLATLALIGAGGAGHRQATVDAMKRIELMWVVMALVGGALAQGLVVVLFGTAVRPDDLVFGVAIATGIVHAIIERSFFHVAVTPLVGSEGSRLGFVALAVIGQALMVATYLGLWDKPSRIAMWAGVAVASVAIPTSLLWLKSRSFYAPLAWQVGMVPVQLALLTTS
jgi:hypothetical protein